MDTSQFNKDKLKRQRNREGWRVIIAFVISLLFIAALMFFSSVLDVWGEGDPYPYPDHGFSAQACNEAAKGYHRYWDEWPAEYDQGDPDGWKILTSKCTSSKRVVLSCCFTGTSPWRSFQITTEKSCPYPEEGGPSSNPESTVTPTATQFSQNSPNGQPPVISTSTSMPPASGPTRTPTPTPTLLIIYPSRTPGAPPPPTGPDMGGTPAPTATPEPFWSPCLLQHAGAPVNLCETGSGSGWWLYFFGPGGQVRTGPYVPRYGGPVDKIFFSTTSPTTGKPVLVQWIAKYQAVRVITYYDHHPYAGHKPYIFDVLPGDRVVYQRW